MSLKDKIFSAEDIASKTVAVPEWGVELEIRSMTGLQRANFLKLAQQENVALLTPALLIACCFDPETGEQVFTEDDVEALNAKNAGVLERLAAECMLMSGIGEQAEKEAGKG